ncbi:hypothetical protein HanXRQr2_Chr10g0455861 [Helianthus annuus]|uniref:Uncharacterized protein n=1 Tax=Helianthus annuus TaxID=4232 RepID=A0A9K3I0E6_HELAN|nr:hypothetical protein HanXRQr2_Chr10g0455861 [Helianthus annuus]
MDLFQYELVGSNLQDFHVCCILIELVRKVYPCVKNYLVILLESLSKRLFLYNVAVLFASL